MPTPLHRAVSEFRPTLALAIPMMAGLLGQMLMSVADTVMIGRLGTTELAAATVGNNLCSAPLLMGIGLLSVVSMRVAQARGADDRTTSVEVVRHGLFVALVFGALAVAGLLALLPWLHIFQQPADVTALAPAFLVPVALSMLPLMVGVAVKGFADAMARPWGPFWIIMGGVIMNVGLNWLLIHGHWGAPRMGMAGAGWATFFSRVMVAGVTFWWVCRHEGFREWRPARWLREIRWAPVRRHLVLGLPVALSLLTEVCAFALAALMSGKLGAVSMAAHQIALTCSAITFMVPLGLSQAVAVRVGELLGSREPGRLRPVAGGALAGVWIFMGLTALVFLTLGRPVAALYTRDPEVIALATRLLWIGGLFQLADGTQVTAAGALRGLNDVRRPALFCLAAYWVIALPLGWTLAFPCGLGARGVWTGLAAGLGVAAVLLTLRLWRRTAV